MGEVVKCPKCRIIALGLIREGLPIVTLKKYPGGICRKCKKKVIKSLRKLLK